MFISLQQTTKQNIAKIYFPNQINKHHKIVASFQWIRQQRDHHLQHSGPYDVHRAVEAVHRYGRIAVAAERLSKGQQHQLPLSQHVRGVVRWYRWKVGSEPELVESFFS